MRVVVHGDDFTALGADEDCEWLVGELRKHFEFKVSAKLGPKDKDDKQAKNLSDVFTTVGPDGNELEVSLDDFAGKLATDETIRSYFTSIDVNPDPTNAKVAS